MIMLDRRLLKNFGWSLFFMILTYSTLALLNLYSVSYQTGLNYFKKQLVWVICGIVSMLLISFVNYRTLRQYALYIYGFSILALIFVLIFGKEVAGARSWISLGSFATIQPSEFVKLSMILAIAKFYHDDYQYTPYGLVELYKPLLLIGLPLGLILMQPDLGTALTIILISGSMVLFMGVQKSSILFVLTLIIGLSFPAWHYALKPYQQDRVKTFLDPSRDPLGAGYNAIQSQIAVGSGGFLGKGFRSGSQTQLRFIPARQTDFAFSVFAEEWGFAGGVFALILYSLIILWMIDTASRAKDKFAMLVSFGIASMFFWHLMVNVGMVIGLLPITGVPLLIFSYGGSSTMTALIGVGIVLGIRMRKLPVTGESMVFR